MRPPALLLGLSLLACSRGERAATPEAAAPATAAAARPADSLAPAPSPAPAPQGGPIAAEELRGYVLTLDNVREMHLASMQWARVAPNRRPPVPDDGAPGLVGAANRLMREFQLNPALARAINASEMTTRRAAVHFTVLAAAGAAAASDAPPPPEIAPENVAFVRGHRAELRRMRNERDAIMRPTMP